MSVLTPNRTSAHARALLMYHANLLCDRTSQTYRVHVSPKEILEVGKLSCNSDIAVAATVQIPTKDQESQRERTVHAVGLFIGYTVRVIQYKYTFVALNGGTYSVTLNGERSSSPSPATLISPACKVFTAAAHPAGKP
eukprot:jgi/Botrbrau1/10393/Bobra.0133s0002.1